MKNPKVYSKFRGYESNSEPTNIDADQHLVFVAPSKNCRITAEGVAVSRSGIEALGSSAGDSIVSAYTWNNNRNVQLMLNSTQDKLRVFYDGDYREILTVANGNFSYAEWWDNTNLRDVLLFVEGTNSVYSWAGAIAKITAVSTTDITIGVSTFVAGFKVGDVVTIDGADYTIMSILSDTEMRLNAAPGAVTDVYVYSKVASTSLFAYTILLDPSSAPTSHTGISLYNDFGFTFDTLAVEDNAVYYGSSSIRRVFKTKNTSFSDCRFSTPRLPGEGDTFVLDAPVTIFLNDSSQGRIIASCGADKLYEIKERVLETTDASSYTAVKRLRSGYGAGIVNKRAASEVKYSIGFVTHSKEIDTLGRVEELDTPTGQPLSYKIKLDLDSLDTVDDAVTHFNTNSLFVSFPSVNKIYEYDFALKKYQPPITVNATAFSDYDGRVVIHDNSGQSHYLTSENTHDNNAPIDCEIYCDYKTEGARYSKKQFDLFLAEGYLSVGGAAQVGFNYGFEGDAGSMLIDVNRENPNTVFHTATVLGGFGTTIFGTKPFGSSISNAQNTTMGEFMEKFRLLQPVSLDELDYYEGQFVVKQSSDTSRLILVSLGHNVRVSPNNAVHDQS